MGLVRDTRKERTLLVSSLSPGASAKRDAFWDRLNDVKPNGQDAEPLVEGVKDVEDPPRAHTEFPRQLLHVETEEGLVDRQSDEDFHFLVVLRVPRSGGEFCGGFVWLVHDPFRSFDKHRTLGGVTNQSG